MALMAQIAQSAAGGDGDYLTIIVFILLYILFLLAIALILPTILRQSRLVSRARRDYQRARGTQHLRQIRGSLKILNKRLDSLEQEQVQQRLSGALWILEQERSDKLSRALCRYLVETQLAQIDGIGPKLQEQIIRYSFDGTLDSLRGAYRVRGVGRQKQWNIQRWVEQKKLELPLLMEQDFPDKRRLQDEYDQRGRELEKSLREVKEQVDVMKQLRTVAAAEEERLAQVTVAHFGQAYKQDQEAAEVVNRYLQGAFAEWEPMPSWFETLISKYGG